MTTLGLYCRLHAATARRSGYFHLPPATELEDLVATVDGEYRVVNVIVAHPDTRFQIPTWAGVAGQLTRCPARKSPLGS